MVTSFKEGIGEGSHGGEGSRSEWKMTGTGGHRAVCSNPDFLALGASVYPHVGVDGGRKQGTITLHLTLSDTQNCTPNARVPPLW